MQERPGDAGRDAAEQRRTIQSVWHRHGEPATKDMLRIAWDAARVTAGVPGALLHDLRRSRVREMERAGIARSVALP